MKTTKTIIDDGTKDSWRNDRGAYCMLTNSDEDFIKNLYTDFFVETVTVNRNMNTTSEKRTAKEVIITNY